MKKRVNRQGEPPGRTNGKEDRSNSPGALHREGAEEAGAVLRPRPLLRGIKGKTSRRVLSSLFFRRQSPTLGRLLYLFDPLPELPGQVLYVLLVRTDELKESPEEGVTQFADPRPKRTWRASRVARCPRPTVARSNSFVHLRIRLDGGQISRIS